MRLETKFVQVGTRSEARMERTGAISFPVYHSAIYRHPGIGRNNGFDYTRTGNPTRQVVEEAIAGLEGGSAGFACSSGMAAVTLVLSLFGQGDHILVCEDLYGGTYRVFETLFARFGVTTQYIDTSDLQQVKEALNGRTKAIFVETPTNPLMRITDIRAVAELARRHGALTILDNTLMTPLHQRPLELGADIVIHSATKYLGGHNDVLGGFVVVDDPSLAERLGDLHNATGATLGPQDAWLLLRGMKTLALRMTRHEENAHRAADFLSSHPLVREVYYPGLPDHPGNGLHRQQSGGAGGLLSFRAASPELVEPLLDSVELISFAESLGGVESLITFPAVQTHKEIPEAIRRRVGVDDALLRLSVGIEHPDDIVADLDQALRRAAKAVGRAGPSGDVDGIGVGARSGGDAAADTGSTGVDGARGAKA